MKIIRSKQAPCAGSVFVVILTVVVIASIILGSYLTMVQTQSASVGRSQNYNAAMAVTEAGIEESLALLNSAVATNGSNPWAFTNNLVNSGWTPWTNGSTVTRTVFGSNTYTATISVNPTSSTPQIDSVGTISYTSIPWVFACLSQPFFAAAGTGTTNQAAIASNTALVSRKVRVMTSGSTTTNGTSSTPLFSYGVLSKNQITLSGTTICDSYDSSNPLYSTNGQYSAALAKAGNGVATCSTVTSAITDSGNLTVYGSLYTGPGGTLTYSGWVKVGDAAWIANNTGIQTNHMRNDMNVAIPSVGVPTGTAWTPSSATIGGTNYYLAMTNNNTLYVSQSQILANGVTILVSGTNVTWWLKSGMITSGQFALLIAPGASLKMYVGNTNGSPVSWTMAGKGVVNDGGSPSAFQYYGLPTNTSFTYSGSKSFVGTFYAPQCAFTMSGGSDYYGAFVCLSLTKSGNLSIHYDEAL
ncbi:MAG: hypothetical protein JWQ71_1938, partial [Pedosphaera sp.]|nr:hypothetical protein [Pedosphaera sp.]